MVVITIAMSALAAVTIWENGNRKDEHERLEQVIHGEIQQLVCVSKLNLFFQTQTKSTPLSWQDIPSEYWPCMPKNLIDERRLGR